MASSKDTVSRTTFLTILIILIMVVYCFARLLSSQQFHEEEDEAERDEVTPAHAPPDY